jgi:hypothetical protein
MEGGEDSYRAVEPTQNVRNGHPHGLGATGGRYIHLSHATEGLDEEVLTGQILVGTLVPIACGINIDKVGVQLDTTVIADPESTHHTGTEVFVDNIRRLDYVCDDGFALGGFQVDGERALVSVVGEERGPKESRVFGRHTIALVRSPVRGEGRYSLHLDHVGS